MELTKTNNLYFRNGTGVDSFIARLPSNVPSIKAFSTSTQPITIELRQ